MKHNESLATEKVCPSCDGKGFTVIPEEWQYKKDGGIVKTSKCPDCKGKGQVPNTTYEEPSILQKHKWKNPPRWQNESYEHTARILIGLDNLIEAREDLDEDKKTIDKLLKKKGKVTFDDFLAQYGDNPSGEGVEVCDWCDGEGVVSTMGGSDEFDHSYDECPVCKGKGIIISRDEAYATASGTSAGAKKAWITRKRGGSPLDDDPDLFFTPYGTDADRDKAVKHAIKSWSTGKEFPKASRKEVRNLETYLFDSFSEDQISNEAEYIINGLLAKGDVKGVLDFVESQEGTSFIDDEVVYNIYEGIPPKLIDTYYPNGVTGAYTEKVRDSTDFLMALMYGGEQFDDFVDTADPEGNGGLNRQGRELAMEFLDDNFDRKAFKKNWGVSWDQYLDDLSNNRKAKYKSEGEIYDIHDVAESVSEVLQDDGYFKQDKDGESITFKYLENYLGGEGWDEQYLTGEADDDY